jgi:hypothetical protein
MSRFAKVFLIAAFALTTLGCSFLQSIVDKAYSQGDSSDLPQSQAQANPDDSQSATQSQEPAQDSIPETQEEIFDSNIPTEVILPNNQVSVPKKMTIYSPLLDSYRTYLFLENNSTDPEDVIVEISYTMTWYDDQNQIVDQWITNSDSRIFPHEYSLIEPWVEKAKAKDHKITNARFELNDVKTIKTGWTDEDLKAKIRSQKVTHPFMTINPEPYRVEDPSFMESMVHAESRAAVQSSMNTKVGVMVVAFYLNANKEMVGVGKGSVEIAPLGSVNVDIIGIHLTEAPASAEYYAIIVGPKELERAIYP